MDIGPKASSGISVLARAKTLVWNGRSAPFEDGTVRQRHRRSGGSGGELTQSGKLVSVAGGGDTVAALNAAGVADRLTYVSTAGGAFLEWLEGKPCAGVEVLRQK